MVKNVLTIRKIFMTAFMFAACISLVQLFGIYSTNVNGDIITDYQIINTDSGGGASTGKNIYYGLLHEHTEDSDGTGSPVDAYRYAKNSAMLDFFGLADHSEQLDDDEWNSQGALVSALNDPEKHPENFEFIKDENGNVIEIKQKFVAFRGFEWTSSAEDGESGHVTVVNTDGYLGTSCEPWPGDSDTMENLRKWLAYQNDSTFAFLNHPGDHNKNRFDDLNYVSNRIVGMELFGAWGKFDRFYYNDGYYGGDDNLSYYDEAIRKGWHIGAGGSDDNHAATWGTRTDYRLAVLADELTKESLTNAIKSRHFYSTLDRDLKMWFDMTNVQNGSMKMMGEIASPGEYEFYITAKDKTGDNFKSVTLIKRSLYNKVMNKWTWHADSNDISIANNITLRNGEYAYIIVKQKDGEEAISSPIYCKSYGPYGPEPGTTYDTATVLHVHVAKEDGAGTSEYVHYKMLAPGQGLNGKHAEYEATLGTTLGSQSMSYFGGPQYYLDNPMFPLESITSMTLEIPAKTDPVKIESIALESNKRIVYAKELNVWLEVVPDPQPEGCPDYAVDPSNDFIYTWDCSIKGPMEAETSAIYDLYLKTLPAMEAATVSPLYANIIFTDGTYLYKKLGNSFAYNTPYSIPIIVENIKAIDRVELYLDGSDNIGLNVFEFIRRNSYYESYLNIQKTEFYDYLDPMHPKRAFQVNYEDEEYGLLDFEVSVKTSMDSGADTDDEVYLELIFNNGYTLDLPLWDTVNQNPQQAFGRGNYNKVSFSVEDRRLDWGEVRSIALRKRGISGSSDSWMPESIAILKDGQCIYSKVINKLLDGGIEAYICVEDLNPIGVSNGTDKSDGHFMVSVKTGNLAEDGTADKMHLILYYADGYTYSTALDNNELNFQPGKTDIFYILPNHKGEITRVSVVKDNSGGSLDYYMLDHLSITYADTTQNVIDVDYNEYLTNTNNIAFCELGKTGADMKNGFYLNYLTYDAARTETVTVPINYPPYYKYEQRTVHDISNTMFVGFEFNNGEKYEFLINRQGETIIPNMYNSLWIPSYNPSFSWADVAKIYFVKSGTASVWTPDSLSLNADNKCFYVRKWDSHDFSVSDNNTAVGYSIPNPISSTRNLLGHVKVTTRTAVDSTNATDIKARLEIGVPWSGLTWYSFYNLDRNLENEFLPDQTDVFYICSGTRVGETEKLKITKTSGSIWKLIDFTLEFPGRPWRSYTYTLNKTFRDAPGYSNEQIIHLSGSEEF
ncbi:MAG: PLAT/LH2 domain-containing protein [Bacillota bacterium]